MIGLGHAQFISLTSDAVSDLGMLLLTGTALAFAEEIGWRGYLQPRLTSWIKPMWSYVVIGLVWAAWHMPYVLFGSDGTEPVTLTLFVASVFAFSCLFGLLRDRSGSMWTAVLAHLAHNVAFVWIGISLVKTKDPALMSYLAGDTGLFVLVGTSLAATWIALSSRSRRALVLARE